MQLVMEILGLPFVIMGTSCLLHFLVICLQVTSITFLPPQHDGAHGLHPMQWVSITIFPEEESVCLFKVVVDVLIIVTYFTG